MVCAPIVPPYTKNLKLTSDHMLLGKYQTRFGHYQTYPITMHIYYSSKSNDMGIGQSCHRVHSNQYLTKPHCLVFRNPIVPPCTKKPNLTPDHMLLGNYQTRFGGYKTHPITIHTHYSQNHPMGIGQLCH